MLEWLLTKDKYKVLKEAIEGASTVDSFQGQEGDIMATYLTVSEACEGAIYSPVSFCSYVSCGVVW